MTQAERIRRKALRLEVAVAQFWSGCPFCNQPLNKPHRLGGEARAKINHDEFEEP